MNDLLYEEPGYASLHNHIGWAHLYYTSDVAKAELHLKMAIKFEAEFHPPYQHIGTLFTRTGRYAEALEYLERGLALKCNPVAFLENMAQVYELKGEYTRAIQTYKKASLASLSSGEMSNHEEGIKRCRKKRLSLFFTF